MKREHLRKSWSTRVDWQKKMSGDWKDWECKRQKKWKTLTMGRFGGGWYLLQYRQLGIYKLFRVLWLFCVNNCCNDLRFVRGTESAAEDEKRSTSSSFFQDVILIRKLFESSGLFSSKELKSIPGRITISTQQAARQTNKEKKKKKSLHIECKDLKNIHL